MILSNGEFPLTTKTLHSPRHRFLSATVEEESAHDRASRWQQITRNVCRESGVTQREPWSVNLVTNSVAILCQSSPRRSPRVSRSGADDDGCNARPQLFRCRKSAPARRRRQYARRVRYPNRRAAKVHCLPAVLRCEVRSSFPRSEERRVGKRNAVRPE